MKKEIYFWTLKIRMIIILKKRYRVNGLKKESKRKKRLKRKSR